MLFKVCSHCLENLTPADCVRSAAQSVAFLRFLLSSPPSALPTPRRPRRVVLSLSSRFQNGSRSRPPQTGLFFQNLSLCGAWHVPPSAVSGIITVFRHVYGTGASEQKPPLHRKRGPAVITCFKQNSLNMRSSRNAGIPPLKPHPTVLPASS